MKRKSPFFLLLWFVLFLPGIRIFLNDLINPSPRFRDYSEGEEDLRFLIDREKASYPDQFLSVQSVWEDRAGKWEADWHVFKPYLDQSVEELASLKIPVADADAMTPEEFWAEVYSVTAGRNRDRIENIARGFLWYKDKNGLTERQLLDLVIRFIQQIPYEIPDNRYGLYSPEEILKRNGGDCDSKSLFAAVLLEEMGYDTAIFYSSAYRHAMLGVDVPSDGVYKELDGRPYYFTEMTAKGWQIGDLPPDCSDPQLWSLSRI